MLRAFGAAAAIGLFAAGLAGCRGPVERSPGSGASMGDRPIEQVLADHTPELMAIPGVVGTAQGQLPSGESSIQVLVLRNDPAILGRIPKRIEGWPVDVIVTGEIRALPDSAR